MNMFKDAYARYTELLESTEAGKLIVRTIFDDANKEVHIKNKTYVATNKVLVFSNEDKSVNFKVSHIHDNEDRYEWIQIQDLNTKEITHDQEVFDN